MKIYIGAPGTLRYYRIIEKNGYGVMATASSWRNIKESVPFWALDNGAYSYWVNNKQFDEDRFFKTLKKAKKQHIPPDFIVIPDIPAGGMRSFWFSVGWIHRLYLGNLYFAVQDGMDYESVKTILKKNSRIAGLFVGGTLKWKLRSGEKWVKLAHKYGKKAHIGRVGTVERLVWALRIGADSVDSSTFVQGPDEGRFARIPRSIEVFESVLCITDFTEAFHA